ncbi:MAG: glycoside hydrolase family 1 protein [Clostridiaceae bacterium]
MKYRFNDNFLWGGAVSGPQTEGSTGKKCDSIWEYWYKKNPEKFYNEVGSVTTSDFYRKYKEYIKIMKDLNIKSYRTSIQWSRLILDREGTVDTDGVIFYNNVINELIKNDIEPMMCLHHFDLPMYWMEKGGFENKETVHAFAEYADICFKLFGDRVKYWSTFNEPNIIVQAQYLSKQHYPCVDDIKRASQVTYNLQLASSLAIHKYKTGKYNGEIGVILNLSPVYPPSSATKEDKIACEIVDLIFNRSFLDPSVKGEYPNELIEFSRQEGFSPDYTKEELNIIKQNTVDYLGANYYHPFRIKAKKIGHEDSSISVEKYFDYYTFEGMKMNKHRGWEIYEKGVYDIAINIRDNYGNIPWYLAENGMGVNDEERFINEEGIIEDEYRIEFIKGHLKYLHKGIEEGSNCFGYHLWSPFDNWSWINAYKNRYGLIRVDINNNCKLSVKKSGDWFKQMVEDKGFN